MGKSAYLTIIVTIAICYSCTSTLAADRFIVKYKLSESQKKILSLHGNLDSNEAISTELRKKLSAEQLDVLSKSANEANALSSITNIRTTDLRSLTSGSHVIILSEDLDEIQTDRFIRIVEQDNSIEYIEEDAELHIL